jgi:RimK family alpha-L-glutamate ligase
MKRKGVILVNTYYFRKEVEYQIERFTKEFGEREISLEVRDCNALLGYILEGEVKLVDFDFDFALYLDKDKYLCVLLETAGIRVFNKARQIEICDEKMYSHLMLTNQGIKMPTTISGALCFTDSEFDPGLLAQLEEVLGYPMIVKESYGSMGKQIKLANNKEELLVYTNEILHRPHLFQQYIKSSHGKDIRLMVIGKKYCAAMYRESKGDFRSNLSEGGVGSPVEPQQAFIDMAEKIAEVLDLDYCGVDLMFGEQGEPIFCEVNSNAFITNLERISKVNVAGIYADYVNEVMYGVK